MLGEAGRRASTAVRPSGRLRAPPSDQGRGAHSQPNRVQAQTRNHNVRQHSQQRVAAGHLGPAPRCRQAAPRRAWSALSRPDHAANTASMLDLMAQKLTARQDRPPADDRRRRRRGAERPPIQRHDRGQAHQPTHPHWRRRMQRVGVGHAAPGGAWAPGLDRAPGRTARRPVDVQRPGHEAEEEQARGTARARCRASVEPEPAADPDHDGQDERQPDRAQGADGADLVRGEERQGAASASAGARRRSDARSSRGSAPPIAWAPEPQDQPEHADTD